LGELLSNEQIISSAFGARDPSFFIKIYFRPYGCKEFLTKTDNKVGSTQFGGLIISPLLSWQSQYHNFE